MVQTADQLILEELVQGVLERKLFLNPRDLVLLRLETGDAEVDFERSSRFGRGRAGWIPRRLTLLRQGTGFRITLSQVQVNPAARAPIRFRDPGELSLYLVKPGDPVPVPEVKDGSVGP